MSDIRVRFACGHEVSLEPTAMSAPVCPCGESLRVSVEAPAPVFRGVGIGPLSIGGPLLPRLVDLAPGGPLWKESR